jgi:putative sterol carrier protein
MDLQACTEALRAKMGESSGLNATLKFDCGSDGCVYLDGKSTPNGVSNSTADAECTVALDLATLSDLVTGELEPTTGFMMGRFKVSGDMSVALKLRTVLS